MDEFKFDKVFSYIDQQGRYSFSSQTQIAKWNILRLSESLMPLINENQEDTIKEIEEEIVPLFDQFDEKRLIKLAEKLVLMTIIQMMNLWLWIT